MQELNSKGLRVLLTFLRNEPLAVDFAKLAKVSPVLLEEVKRQPQISKFSKFLEVGYLFRADFWGLRPDEALIDWAYRFRRFGLGELPPKNAEPYQIISHDNYDRIANPLEYLRKYSYRLSEEQQKEVLSEAEKRKKEGAGLHYANEEIWKWVANRDNFAGLMWLAKNFTMREDRPILILAFLADGGKLSLMKKIYEGYRDKIDWGANMRISSFALSHPFFASLIEDRTPAAIWLAETFDMSQRFGDSYDSNGRKLFEVLTILNNKAAIEWLVRKYKPLAAQVISFSQNRKAPRGKILWLMAESGRVELATFLSRHYNIPLVEPSPEEKGRLLLSGGPWGSVPSTKRWSEFNRERGYRYNFFEPDTEGPLG